MEQVAHRDWHPEDIKAAIRKTGTTLSELARDAGFSKQVLSACLTSRASERGDQIIAEAVGLKPHQIWPSRYRKNGERLRFRALSETERAAA